MKALKEFVTFPLYTMVRPFSAFEDIKYGVRGRKLMILVAIIAIWIAIAAQTQYAGFIVNENDPLFMNSIRDLYGVVAVFMLFCIGNWSITSLFNGEGKLIQIMTGLAYALTPFFLSTYIAVILSRFITEQESAFYYMAISLGTFWSAFLLFAAIATIHNYTVLKTVLTMIFTVVAMAAIIFIVMMIGALLQQVYFFGYNIYLELTYRM